ncbi:hypothetical protein O5O45_07660 [Hahella aquimaris]|uniref:hypothetical protein n=1 Tax=Hahella sp. HNIBRBA332 TaxID=3015983 RepID=UPI00273C7A02|nr:hypothetical protein [Hahella sp. HNIBRBA332]WLQ15787.1 hypothetical protein O5O45_07660 [Hahella sp. HNIBRBA332]
MEGVFQYRLFFFYFDLFTLDKSGMWCKGKYYRWEEVKDLRERDGTAVLTFSDGKSRMFQYQRFKQKNRKLTLTFFGRNETYEQFQRFIFEKIRENNEHPDLKRLRKLVASISERIESSNSERELLALRRDFKVTVSQLASLERREFLKNMEKCRTSIRNDIIFLLFLASLMMFGIM